MMIGRRNPVLEIAIATLDRNVDETLPRCDHAIVIGRVRAARGMPESIPCLAAERLPCVQTRRRPNAKMAGRSIIYVPDARALGEPPASHGFRKQPCCTIAVRAPASGQRTSGRSCGPHRLSHG
jgi:hypothetical protein